MAANSLKATLRFLVFKEQRCHKSLSWLSWEPILIIPRFAQNNQLYAPLCPAFGSITPLLQLDHYGYDPEW